MKKIILSACFLFSTIIACAQVVSSSGRPYTALPGIDYVFIFNGITSATDITYTGNGTSIKWYKFSDLTTPISEGTKEIFNPDDATGYILDVDGAQTTIWVIDYKNYLPVFKSFEPENNPGAQCQTVNLLIDGTVPLLTYKTTEGISHTLPRNCSIHYNTLKWEGTAWATRDTTFITTIPATRVSVAAPYCTTTFTLSGDQYARDMGIDTFKVTSASYTPVAVISHLTTNVTSREHDKNNEASAPSHAVPINFSAPIDVQFLSNANEPITQFYNWGIYKDKKLLINRTDKDHRYTFTEAGTYTVKLTVSNSTCSFSDSLTIDVSESAIYVPDVFTPNGDGFNDEFRVAYKSLISFQCWVYNRWGRQVYYWADPTKGWDGNINGKKAVPGPYFYVIKAVGSDKKKYKLSGDINLLRGVAK